MICHLPTRLEVCGVEYEIRSDYRAVLDICAALNESEFNNNDRGIAVLTIFYPDLETMPYEHYDEAIQKCFWFLNGGAKERDAKTPRLMDWEQDFEYLVAPINRILGQEIRAADYVHWWTFLSAYREIGDCFFSQIISIRSKKAKNRKLDKTDQEFYRQNQDIIDLKTAYTENENDLLEQWGAR